MFSYSSMPEVLPSLTFTKAELVYALTRLLKDVDNNDNSTKIELVELRHYLNLIKDDISSAAIRRELSLGKQSPTPTAPPTVVKEEPKKPIPSMAELKKQFPSLAEDEIKSIIANVRREAEKERRQQEEHLPPPPPPNFIAASEDDLTPLNDKAIATPHDDKDRENAQKFASLLGTSW